MKPTLDSRFVERWLWLYPALAIVMAAAVFAAFGLDWSTALLAAALLACAVIIGWGAIEAWRDGRRRPRP
jgi:hypothetical protein